MTQHQTTTVPVPPVGQWHTVNSADGTPLGILSLGNGPGVVIVHGAMQSATSQLDLAGLLAGDHTVHLLERRGRGRSGAYPAGSATSTDVDDLAAVLAATGSRAAFGISSGALIVLRAALSTPGLDRVAAFEPPLIIDGAPAMDFDRLDRELSAEDLPGAMITAMLGAQMGPSFLRFVPRPLMRAMAGRQLAKDVAKQPDPAQANPADLVRALRQDFVIVREQADTLADFAAIDGTTTSTLLLAGTKTRPYLRRAVDVLGSVVPGSTVDYLAGTNHAVTQNRDQWGKPDLVAPALLAFLAD